MALGRRGVRHQRLVAKANAVESDRDHERRPRRLESVSDAARRHVTDTIDVGTEPFGCAVTPDGKRLYDANQSSNTVSVINTRNDRLIRTTDEVGEKPHAIATTADGRKV